MPANTTSLYSSSSSNITLSSNNLTTLYPGSSGTVTPAQPYGNANVVSLLAVGTDGANTVGNISATGNITGAYFLGNGSQLTGLPATYSNANVVALLAAFGSNTISTTGNVTSGNLQTSGQVSATGNVTGAYIFGNGSQLTGLSATYSNANVVALMAAFGSNSISTTGNITAGNFAGNGSQLSAIAGANVTGTVANATYATAAGSATTAGTVTTNAQPNITSTGTLTSLSVSGNTTSGNLLTPGIISASGNITTAGYFVGNFAGNISGNITVPGANTDVLFNNNGNAGASNNFTFNSSTNVMNVTGSATVTGTITGGNISTAGNVTGAYILGNGSQLSAITGANVTGPVANATFATSAGSATTAVTANTVTDGAQANITSVGTLTSLSVSGNTTTGNLLTGGLVSATGNITGSYILGNGSQLTGLPTGYSNADVVTLLAAFGSNTISTTGNITAGYFVGNGSLLTSLTGANVTGTVANATYATAAGTAGTANTAVTVTGNAQANITSVGTLTSLSVSGNINGSNVNASTVQATSSAGLSLKNSAGTTQASMGAGGGDNFAISVSTNINGANAQIDISPTGNSGHVHIKPTGLNSVEIAPTYPGSINNMVIGNITPAAVSATTVSASGNITTAGAVSATGNVSSAAWVLSGTGGSFNGPVYSTLFSTTGNITGDYFIGNGSLLTGLPAGSNISNGTSNINIAVSNGNATVNIGGTANVAVFATTGEYVTGVVSATGNVTGSNITTPGFVSASGNIAATGWVFGNTGGSFNGPVYSTLVSATGNVTGGNLLTTGQASVTGNLTAGNIITVGSTINNTNAWAFSPANTLLSLNNARIIIGNAYDGNSAVQYDPLNTQRGARLLVMDKQSFDYTANSLQPGTRLLTSYYYPDLAGTTIPSSSATRHSAGAFLTNIGNGTSAQTGLGIFGVQAALLVGNASNPSLGNVGNIGNATINFAVGQGTYVNVYNGSTANNVIGSYSSPLIASSGGVMGNSLGFAYSRADAANNLSTWNIGFFHPDNSAIFGSSMSGNARLATNYYAFYNKDNYADVQLGSLRSFHYYTSNVLATGGSQAISKANGPYQTTTGNLTANLDITSFTNFVTSNTVTAGTNTGTKLASDVVTLLVPMGATPYSINMPTGNTQIKYVGNISTVTGPANSITQVQITGSNVGGTTQYLVNMENSGSNILTDGLISATGNITGGNVISLARAQAVNFSETVTAFGNATGTITPNISLGAIQTMTLTGNITLNAITNIATGQSMTLILTQDATGGRTLTSSMLFAGGNKTLSTAAAAKDLVVLFYDGSTYYASLSKGYA